MTVMTKEQIEALLDGTTLGPWTVETGNVSIADTGDYDGYCRLMAGGRIIFEQWGDDEQSEKDAALAGAAPDLARTALALHQQLADAQAAQALVLERAAEIADGYHQRAIEWAKKVRGLDQHIDETDSSRIAKDIRALASPSGVEELTKLRARADEAEKTLAYCEKQWADTDRITHAKMLSERTHAEKAEAERDDLRARLAAAEDQVARLVGALEFYANERNYDQNGPLDSSGSRFTYGPARAAIAEVQADARREGGE